MAVAVWPTAITRATGQKRGRDKNGLALDRQEWPDKRG